MESSDKRSRRIRVNPFRISCSVMLHRPPGNVGRVWDIVGQLQEPPRRAVMGRALLRELEAEGCVQLFYNSIFGSRYVVGAKRPYTHPKRSLHCDIHCFPLQLATEHPATHDPGIDLDQIGRLEVWRQNHRADKAVVTELVDEAEL